MIPMPAPTKGGTMPQILVATDTWEDGERAVVYRERIAPSDLESDHFSGQLVERVGWAVQDADEIEQKAERTGRDRPPARREPEPVAPLSDDIGVDGVDGVVEIDRMDLALALAAGLDRGGDAVQLP